MILKCRECGLVANDSNAKRCSLCDGELQSAAVSALSRIAKANRDSVDSPSAATTASFEGDGQSTNAESQQKLDQRPWLAKIVHRRSKGGIFFGIVAITIGAFGGVITRRNLPIGGSSLVGVGVAVMFFAIILYWLTSLKRRYW